MTDMMSTMLPCADEAASDAVSYLASPSPLTFSPVTFSPVTLQFASLLHALDTAVEAERDIECAEAFDPAYSDGCDAAEHAWARTADLCRSVFELPAQSASDAPLQNMAELLHFVLGCESHAEYCGAEDRLLSDAGSYNWFGHDPLSRRISAMLARATEAFYEIGALEMIAGLVGLDPTADADAPELSALLAAE